VEELRAEKAEMVSAMADMARRLYEIEVSDRGSYGTIDRSILGDQKNAGDVDSLAFLQVCHGISAYPTRVQGYALGIPTLTLVERTAVPGSQY